MAVASGLNWKFVTTASKKTSDSYEKPGAKQIFDHISTTMFADLVSVSAKERLVATNDNVSLPQF